MKSLDQIDHTPPPLLVILNSIHPSIKFKIELYKKKAYLNRPINTLN